MATLTEIYALLRGSPLLKQRFMASRIKASWDVLNESVQTEYHTERLVWANNILDNYEKDVDKEYARFLSNTTIQASGNDSTDNDIQYVTNSLVNTFVGV